MKFSSFFFVTTSVILLLVIGCEQPNAPQSNNAPSSLPAGTLPLEKKGNHHTCSCTSECVPVNEATLWGKKNLAVGSVTITRDEMNLFVTYTTVEGWSLDETHLDVSAEQYCKRGAPGKYLFKKEHAKGATTYTYTVPITWVEGTTVYFLAHAEVKKHSRTESVFAGTIVDPKHGAWFGQFCYIIEPSVPPPPPAYSVSGIVFFDTDNDGLYTAGEPGIANVTIELSNGTITTTDANGQYSISGLSPDTYTVIAPALDGLSPTSTLTKKFLISSENYSANFGYTDIAP